MSLYMPKRELRANHLKEYYSTHCPRLQVARTNLCHTFSAVHQRDVGHPIRKELSLVPGYRKVVSLTCKPLISSSKPNEQTTVRAGLKPFSSKVSIDDLFGIGIQRASRQRRVQYPNQPTLIIEASPAPDVFTCNHSVSHLNTRTQLTCIIPS